MSGKAHNKRLWAGRLLALAIGLALIAIVEFVVRQVPALQAPPFSVEMSQVEGRALKTVNPQYAQRFFFGPAAVGMRMAPHPYVEPAPARALRVLFVGGSTVQGYPHPQRLSAPAYLQAMLEDLWPGRAVEVFNVGITAVSSFVVARVVEDAMVLQPDLVVVYSGHNEIYGVYGSASLSQGGSSIVAKRLHYGLMQWSLSALVRRALDASRPDPGNDPPESLLRVMAEAGLVAVGDPRREQAAGNLRANLLDIAETCRQNGAQLLLCTLVSNERGFAASFAKPPLAGAELDRWQQRYRKGRQLLEEGNARQALRELDAAVDLYAANAAVEFYRGRCLEALGKDEAARKAYVHARDLDLRPWRAHSALNEIIRTVAVEQGLMLADIEVLFSNASPPAGIGWELMADHLHPTAEGQMLLARGIVEGLEQGADALRPELLALLSADEYRRQQGDIALERLAVLHDMGILLSEEPMSQGNEEQALALSGRADSLWKTLAPGEQNAYQRWRQGRGPELLALNAADQLFATGDFLRAASYYRAARREEPYTPWGDLWATLRWGRSRQLLLGALDLAERQQIEEMLLRLQFVAQSPDFSPGLNDFFTGYAEYLLGGEASVHLEKSAADPTVRRLFFFDLLALLCDELGRVGRFGDAERYVREITGELGQEQYGRLLLKSLQQLRQK